MSLFSLIQHKNFSITFFPKLGSMSLKEWSTSNDLRVIKNPAEIPPNDVYSIWRPAYERIVTGINTGLNITALEEGPESGIREKFIELAHAWCLNPNLYSNAIINGHTWLTQDSYHQFEFNKFIWVNLQDLDKLHLFLNNKYQTNFSPIRHINAGNGTDRPNEMNLTPIGDLYNILSHYPKTIKFIKEYAAKDYVPDKLISLESK